jgi:cation transport ATPase
MKIPIGRFNRKLSFEPQNIREMTADLKRDCMDELENRRGLAVKFSLLFLLAVIIYFSVKNFYNLLFTLREFRLPRGTVSPVVLLFPAAAVFLAVFADILKRRTVVVSVLVYAGFAAYMIISSYMATRELVSVESLLALFSLGGSLVCYNLLEVCDAHEVLMKEKGYPDFFTLPTKDMVAGKNPATDEVTVNETAVGELPPQATLSNKPPLESPNSPAP